LVREIVRGCANDVGKGVATLWAQEGAHTPGRSINGDRHGHRMSVDVRKYQFDCNRVSGWD
jgi:hypothetical protein